MPRFLFGERDLRLISGMFKNAFRLPFKLLGIPVQLDVSFLLVLPLFAWLIGNNIEVYVEILRLKIEPEVLKEGYAPYLVGLVSALGLFGSVLIHELGHCVVGRYYRLEIVSITLWLLGGMAQFKRMPKRGGVEAVVAIAGPVTSFAVAGVCWVLLQLTPVTIVPLHFVLAYLVWMNVVLATFNLLPALPLDGGRVLRSLLALRSNHLKATLGAAALSRVIALGMGLVGLMTGHIFLLLIAFFVFMAGMAESQMAMAADLLRGIHVLSLIHI